MSSSDRRERGSRRRGRPSEPTDTPGQGDWQASADLWQVVAAGGAPAPGTRDMTPGLSNPSTTGFGGILLPFEMFRPSHLADALAQGLVAKVRNALDASLVLTRHRDLPLLSVRIEGSVIGEDEGRFWLESADLVMYASMVVPRQAFLYYRATAPERREGFVIAQRGKALGADEASASSLPENARAEDWPLARLCQQIRISTDELADGFEGGPRVVMPLMEPDLDDERTLMTLAGQPLEDEGAGPADELGQAPGDLAEARSPLDPTPPPAAAPAATAAAARKASARQAAEQDLARRAAERAAELEEIAKNAATVAARARPHVDTHGVVVELDASLTDVEALSPFVVAEIGAELPPGLPPALLSEVSGRRCDVVVRVEFLSELLYGGSALHRGAFERDATSTTIDGVPLRVLAVQAPRLCKGTLYRHAEASPVRQVFVSRPASLPLPAGLLGALLGG